MIIAPRPLTALSVRLVRHPVSSSDPDFIGLVVALILMLGLMWIVLWPPRQ